MKRNCLFQKSSISNVLDAQGAQCRQKVDAIAKDQFLGTPVDDLVDFVVAQIVVQPLVIYDDRMSREQHEINIDVAGWPGRYTYGDGPCLVPGIRVVVSLPYSGDQALWDIQPNTISTGRPFGSVRSDVLEMTFECPIDQSLDRIKQRLDENIQLIKQYLGWQEASISDFNRNLPTLARAAIEARRKRLEKHDQVAGLLISHYVTTQMLPSFVQSTFNDELLNHFHLFPSVASNMNGRSMRRSTRTFLRSFVMKAEHSRQHQRHMLSTTKKN